MLTQRAPISFDSKNYWQRLPDVRLSHILLRIPLSLVFINQGLSKFPFDPAVGLGMGIPALVWWFVCYGEVAAGLGLLIGGLTTIPRIKDITFLAVMGDLVTRFSGIVMCCVVTGVIWTVLKPESLITFILTDYLHFSLWAGGLYFGLRGNWAVAIDRKT
jgi:putative oxidoreductase